jgi:hypothetical protein
MEQVGDIGIVYMHGMPESLLALIGLEDPFVYPVAGIPEKDYYSQVRERFCTVKRVHPD